MAKMKILIVEDDPVIAEDIEAILENHGMEVCGKLPTGEAALSYANQTKPDLVLMDIRLEGEMDGIETAMLIWQDLNIPCVYLTAYSDEKTLQRAKRSHPLAFLVKPFTERELCIALEIALNQRAFPTLMEVSGSTQYHLLRKALTNTHDFSVGTLDHNEGKTGFQIFIKADPDRILVFKKAMGDLSNDVLDILCALWLQRSESADYIEVSADEILRFRGLQQQKSGSGRRGGYDLKWREQIGLHLEILAHLWISEAGQKSRPLLRQKQTSTPFTWWVKPGESLSKELFSPSPKTALLSQNSLQYNPYKQSWEKRLTRFLSHQWRKNMPQVNGDFVIQELLDELYVQIDYKHPLRTKDRLEKALNTLTKDRVIEKWGNPGKSIHKEKKLWVDAWCKQLIQIETPLNIIEQYSGLGIRPSNSGKSGQFSFAFIKQIRRDRDLSLMEAAAEIGITHARLSQIERGDQAGPKTLKKIKTWLMQQF